MKTGICRIGIFLSVWWMAFSAQAQFFSHSLIYTTDSVRFTVYLDGQKINPVPQTRVRSINLDQPYYKLRIVFEDKSIEPIERPRFFLRDTYGYPVALEHQLKRRKKGGWKMKWRAQESWPGEAVTDANSYRLPDPEAAETAAAPCGGKTADAAALNGVLESISRLDADETKLLVEKQFVSTNCVTVASLIPLLRALADESKKLELARHAYPYTADKGNYHQLNAEFKNAQNIEELYRSIAR